MTSEPATTDAGTSACHLATSLETATLDVDPADVVTFPQGLPGFETSRRFVVLSSGDIAPLQCLHGVGGPPVSFIAIDPRRVLPDYRCILGDADRARLGSAGDRPLLWLALVTLGGDGAATVNLRAPIVIDPERMIGCQLLPHDSPYALRQELRLD